LGWLIYDANRKEEGLRLAVTKSLALFLGVDILVKSKIGVGSTFTLMIPVINAGYEDSPVINGK
jgi:signal transduction histidine kinase